MEKRLAQLLISKYETNNPFNIIKLLDIMLMLENLGLNTWGYYTNICRIPCVHVNNRITEKKQMFTAAHELGHHFLHKGISTPFLRANTLQSIDKIERQANKFAVELLIPDKLLIEGATLYEAATICGVPQEVLHLKQVPEKKISGVMNVHFSVCKLTFSQRKTVYYRPKTERMFCFWAGGKTMEKGALRYN